MKIKRMITHTVVSSKPNYEIGSSAPDFVFPVEKSLEYKIDELSLILTRGFQMIYDKIDIIENKLNTSGQGLMNIEKELNHGFKEILKEVNKLSK